MRRHIFIRKIGSMTGMVASGVAYILSLILGFAVLFPMLFSYLYFPLRLYYSGKPHTDRIQRCATVYTPSMDGGTVTFHVTLERSGKQFDCSDSYDPGQPVNYVSNDKLNKSILVGKGKPTLFNLIIHYKPYGGFIVLLSLGFILFVVIFAATSYRQLISDTLQNVRKSFIPTTTTIEKIASYTKISFPILTALLFAYVVLTFVIKAVLLIENVDELIGNIVISYGTILILFTPWFIRKFAKSILSTQNKNIRNIKAIVTTLIGLSGVYGVFKFLRTHDLSKIDSLRDLFITFIKSLIQ